jgi:hypothetical protein
MRQLGITKDLHALRESRCRQEHTANDPEQCNSLYHTAVQQVPGSYQLDDSLSLQLC